MAKRGPKPTEFDWEQFDKLCFMQCTLSEIAAWFGVSARTVENVIEREKGMKFFAYYEQKRDGGKISLRRMQWQSAEKGNVAILIWLGKQYLGQSDKLESKQEIRKQEDPDKLSDSELAAIAQGEK